MVTVIYKLYRKERIIDKGESLFDTISFKPIKKKNKQKKKALDVAKVHAVYGDYGSHLLLRKSVIWIQRYIHMSLMRIDYCCLSLWRETLFQMIFHPLVSVVNVRMC